MQNHPFDTPAGQLRTKDMPRFMDRLHPEPGAEDRRGDQYDLMQAIHSVSFVEFDSCSTSGATDCRRSGVMAGSFYAPAGDNGSTMRCTPELLHQ
jgi:hypothetical protein